MGNGIGGGSKWWWCGGGIKSDVGCGNNVSGDGDVGGHHGGSSISGSCNDFGGSDNDYMMVVTLMMIGQR